MTDEELDAFIAALPPCPDLPSTDEELAKAIAGARDDVAAGHVYPHALVAEWAQSFSAPGSKSFFEWLADRNG